MLTANEIVDLDQPKAASNGTIKTAGAERYPALAARVRKVSAKANQAGWILFTTLLLPLLDR
jgi:hypothetical protein